MVEIYRLHICEIIHGHSKLHNSGRSCYDCFRSGKKQDNFLCSHLTHILPITIQTAVRLVISSKMMTDSGVEVGY